MVYHINFRPKHRYTSFENLVLKSEYGSKSQAPVLLVIVYRPPGPFSAFLSDFSDFISDLVPQTDKVITADDFNIHVDVGSDSLSYSFTTLVDSVVVSQHVE